MEQFKVGDFDLVLLGNQSAEHKERLTGLVALLAHARRGLHPEPFRRPQFVSGWDPPGRCKRAPEDMEDILAKAARARACRVLGAKRCWGSISLN